METTLNYQRGQYNQFISYPEWVRELLKKLDGVSWTTGIESDKKQRGSSINVDVCAFDEAKTLAVIQVRECIFSPGRFNKVRKDYYLCGYNENGNAFAHPVETILRNKKALETPEGGVLLTLSRIWDCPADDLDDIQRNGDVAFVPISVNKLPASAIPVQDNGIKLADSHIVEGKQLLKDDKGNYYVKGRAKIKHEKGQHPTALVKSGIWRIQVGIRSRVWGFSTPTAD